MVTAKRTVQRVGFIVEGDTEKIVIDSEAFRTWARTHGIDICSPVIDAKGGGNLLPRHLGPLVERLNAEQPDHIVILTDREDAPDVATVRQRIGTTHTRLVFVAVKALEAWFLADSQALQTWLAVPGVSEDHPEQTPGMPWDRLKELAAQHQQRGPGGSKTQFAKRMVKHYQFSIERAAAHPHCPSATEFHAGLTSLTQPQS